MPFGPVPRSVRTGLVLLAAALLTSPRPSMAGEGVSSKLQASYDINFNGINVGSYEFSSSQDSQSYKLSSNAKLSILLGAVQWTGNTQASGKMTGDAAKPQTFGFDFKSQSKAGSTLMNFTDDTVTQVLHTPPPKIKEGVIPVQAQHLKGVLDPLTAVMAMSRPTSGSNPCSHRLPVYDGYQRFDLVLSMKGQVQLENGQGNGFACRVRYVPIAGYKPDDNTQYMADNRDIEIILRPLAGTGSYVPHKITIPTIAGPASLVARRILFTSNGQQQLAEAQ